MQRATHRAIPILKKSTYSRNAEKKDKKELQKILIAKNIEKKRELKGAGANIVCVLSGDTSPRVCEWERTR